MRSPPSLLNAVRGCLPMQLLLAHKVREPDTPVRLCLASTDGAAYFSSRWSCCDMGHMAVPGIGALVRIRGDGTHVRELVGALFATCVALVDRIVIRMAVDYVHVYATAPQYAAANAISCLLRCCGKGKESRVLHCAIVHRYVIPGHPYIYNGPRPLLVAAIYQQLQLPFAWSGYYPYPLHRFPVLDIRFGFTATNWSGDSYTYLSGAFDLLNAQVLVWLCVYWCMGPARVGFRRISHLHRQIEVLAWRYTHLSLTNAANCIASKIFIMCRDNERSLAPP
jgi:hypothetical protein